MKGFKHIFFLLSFALVSLLSAGIFSKTDVHAAKLYYGGAGGHVYGVPGRKPEGKQWFYFTVSGSSANKGNEAFCRTASAGAAHGLTVSVKKSKGPAYALKAMTWYFTKKHDDTGRRATQAFIWAKGRKSSMAKGYAQYWDDIAKTTGIGYVLNYNTSKGGMQGWYGYEYREVPIQYGEVQEKKQDTLDLKYKMQIKKLDAETGQSIDTGTFHVMFDNVKIGQKNNKRDKKTSKGIYETEYTHKQKVNVKSKKYKYIKNWNLLSASQKNSAKKKAYQSKAAAKKAAKEEVKEKFKKAKKNYENAKHTWTVTEVNAPEGHFLQSPAQMQMKVSYHDPKAVFIFRDPAAKASVSIKKSSDHPEFTGLSLKDAKFALYANDPIKTTNTTYLKIDGQTVGKGTQIAIGSTDVNGNLIFASKIYPGSYYIKEISAPKGFLTYDKAIPFTVGQHTKETSKAIPLSFTVKESAISGKIQIKKQKGYEKTAENGIQFNILTLQDIEISNKKYKSGDVVDSITTNDNGTAASKFLPAGSYKVVQKNTGEDSVKTDPWVVNITDGSEKIYSYTKCDVQLKIKKLKKEEGKDAVAEANAVFEVRDKDDALIGKITTDKNGEGLYSTVVSGNKELSYGSTYKLVQIEGDKDYSFAEPTTFILDDSLNTREYAYTFVDTSKKSCVLMKYKWDVINNIKEPEPGAKFVITRLDKDNSAGTKKAADNSGAPEKATTEDKEETDVWKDITITTNDAGIYILSDLNLPEGMYNIHQTEGEEGYAFANDISIRVDADGRIYKDNEKTNTLSITMTDPSTKNALSIKKVMVDYDGKKEKEEGAIFTILKADSVDKSDLDKLTTAALRQEYVDQLKEKDKTSVIGQIITGKKGEGSLELTENTPAFVILQIEGREGYTLTDPVYSTDKNAVRVETTSTGNKIYSFSAEDAKESTEKVSVYKQKKDANGILSDEENAVFRVIDVEIAEKYGLKDADLDTLAKCKAFVAKLPANATIGTLTTDENGISDTTLQLGTDSSLNTKKDTVEDIKSEEPSLDETDDEDETELDEDSDSDGSYTGDIDVDEVPKGDSGNDVTEETPVDTEVDKGIINWSIGSHKKGFVVIQCDGDPKYEAIKPLYSSDKSGFTIKETIDENGMKTTSYSFSAIDEIAKVKIKLVKNKRVAIVDGKDITKPEAGAKFALYDSEKGITTKPICTFETDENGVGESPKIPIGSYILHQLDGEPGYQKMQDQTVTPGEDELGGTHEISDVIVNKESSVTVRVTKTSKETGKKLGKALFEIYKKADMDLTTWKPKEDAKPVRSLYTNSEGTAACQLPYGEYALIEASAPLGYIKSDEGVSFVLNSETTTVDENGNRIYDASAKFSDIPIYGEIQGEKTGEVLAGKDDNNVGFSYETRGIEGAVYTLYARKDIVNDNDEVQWAAGTKITEAATDKNGKFFFTNPKPVETMASNRDFWCGEYYFKETTTPYGFTTDDTEHDVLITWDKRMQNSEIKDDTISEDGFEDDNLILTRGVNHILEQGTKLNPLIKNAKTITFTWEKQPANAVDVSVTTDGETKAKDVWMWDDGEGNYFISSGVDDEVINFSADSSHMFENCTQLQEIYFDNVSTAQVRNYQYMFAGDPAIKELDLSSFSFAAAMWVDNMYKGCSDVKTIYSAGVKQAEDGEVTLIPVAISAVPINNFCVTEKSDDAKFVADDFQFTMKYLRSDGMESGGVFDIVTVTDDDIESFSPSGPWSKDIKEVGITFKNTSQYAQFGSIKVPIVVEGPEDYDETLEIDEHPVANTNLLETKQNITLTTLKVEDGTNTVLDGAIIGLYADCDIYNVDGAKLYSKGDLINKLETSKEFGGVQFSNLPTDAYVKKRGENMYCLKEIAPPAGYKKSTAEYHFKGVCEDKTHCIFYHTYADDSSVEVANDSSCIYHKDSDVIKNIPDGQLGIMKLWNDGNNAAKKRPKEIIIHIKDNDLGRNDPPIETITLTATDNWTASSKVLSQADIKGMSDSDFKKKYTVTEEYVDGYGIDQSKNACLTKQNGMYVFKFENQGKNLTESTVKKVWEDQNNVKKKRPSEVKVQLYQDGKKYGDSVTLPQKLADGTYSWEYTQNRLPQYNEETGELYKYTWKEELTDIITDNPNTGYTISYDVDEENNLTTITNTLRTGVKVVKEWKDSDDAAHLRPAEVKVQLYQNGVSMGEDYLVTLNDANNWSYYIQDVPVNDKDGNAYTYTWKEMDADWLLNETDSWKIGYLPSYESKMIDGVNTTTITNTPQTQGSVSVYKELDPDDVCFDHENPTFTFHLNGTNWKGEKVSLSKTVEYTKEDVEEFKKETHADGDKIRKEAVFAGVEMGTYTVTETGAEDLYEFQKLSVSGDNVKVNEDKKSATVVIGKDTASGKIYSTGTASFYNRTYRGSIKVIKYSDDKKQTLKGVTFVLRDSKGNDVAEKTTDANGEIQFKDLKRGKYTLVETKTVSGHELLKDPVEITLPQTLNKAQVLLYNADTSKGKYWSEKGTYDFYDLTYEIVNNTPVTPPFTGAFENWWMYLPIVLAMTLFIGVGVYRMKRKKKPAK